MLNDDVWVHVIEYCDINTICHSLKLLSQHYYHLLHNNNNDINDYIWRVLIERDFSIEERSILNPQQTTSHFDEWYKYLYDTHRLFPYVYPVVDRGAASAQITSDYILSKVLITSDDSHRVMTDLLFILTNGTFPSVNTSQYTIIGIDFQILPLLPRKGMEKEYKPHKIQLWITAGPERFRAISATYYRGAHLIITGFDLGEENLSFIHSSNSLYNAKHNIESALDIISDQTLMFLIGYSRSGDHIVSGHVTKEDILRFCADHGVLYFEIHKDSVIRDVITILRAFDRDRLKTTVVVPSRSNNKNRKCIIC